MSLGASCESSPTMVETCFKVSFALEWEEFTRINEEGEEVRQTATYHYNAFYSGTDGGLTVDKAVGVNIFRVNDWASGVRENAKNPKKVFGAASASALPPRCLRLETCRYLFRQIRDL